MEAGNVIALAQVTSSLGAQITSIVTTPWWEAEVSIMFADRMMSMILCDVVLGINVKRMF